MLQAGEVSAVVSELKTSRVTTDSMDTEADSLYLQYLPIFEGIFTLLILLSPWGSILADQPLLQLGVKHVT